MQLTPRGRKRYYQQAIKYLKESLQIKHEYRLRGICAILLELSEVEDKWVPDVLIHFPEVMQQKPLILYKNTGWWFDPEDNASRIKVLKKAIELTGV